MRFPPVTPDVWMAINPDRPMAAEAAKSRGWKVRGRNSPYTYSSLSFLIMLNAVRLRAGAEGVTVQ